MTEEAQGHMEHLEEGLWSTKSTTLICTMWDNITQQPLPPATHTYTHTQFSDFGLFWGLHLLSPSPATWQRKGASMWYKVWAEGEWRCKAMVDFWGKFLLWSKVWIIQVMHTLERARTEWVYQMFPVSGSQVPGHLELLSMVINQDMPRKLSSFIDWINNICHLLVLLVFKYTNLILNANKLV